eukprot:1781068-Prorocentrum_lima.AAC.1
MTSSLVGSEMCIRDRQRRKKKKKTWCGTDVMWSAGRVLFGIVPTTNGAVSYTHLTLPTICSV